MLSAYAFSLPLKNSNPQSNFPHFPKIRFRTITSSYYRGSHGIILVYDVTDVVSFNNIGMWVREIEKYMGNETPTLLLVGNKVDQSEKRTISAEKGEEFAQELNCHFLEASAKDSWNVDKIFQQLSQGMRKRMAHHPLKTTEGVFIPTDTQTINESSTCAC
eukprot:TRINITY_DN648_c0_g2_i33.p1 TRINITY_DN648_c0_g2~~TRINITY_DN648_c0_g2_i33.p1  ORF type:complete len:161 (+),score=30.97 TRINITY_DN648_c0_g2_i33:426-908(+)